MKLTCQAAGWLDRDMYTKVDDDKILKKVIEYYISNSYFNIFD